MQEIFSFFIDHSKIQKDGIPNFQFLLLNGNNIHSTSNEGILAQKIQIPCRGSKVLNWQCLNKLGLNMLFFI